MRSISRVLIGAAAVVLGLAAAAGWWVAQPGTSGTAASTASDASGTPAPTPAGPPRIAGDTFGPESFPIYAVNSNGTSVDDDRCIVPVTRYESGQADWAEDFGWGGRFYVNFTGQPDGHVAAIRALIPADCAVYVRIVPVSRTTGRALQERITDDAVAHVVPGVQVTMVGFDPVSDRVLVGILGSVTPQIRAEFESRYPAEMIELFTGAPAQAVDSPAS